MSHAEALSPRPDDRAPVLVERRRRKMARSAHAYVRGATQKFYEWLDAQGRAALPEGPAVWICGDCHLGNLGPVADVHGRVSIQIRDLDQTVIGNPAHDLIRLALSLATAARGSDLPGVTTARMMEQMVEGYSKALTSPVWRGAPDAPMPKKVRALLDQALRRRWRHLAEERIEDVRPSLPIGKTFWKLTRAERAELEALFQEEPVRRLITALEGRDDDAPVEVLDAAYWIKGCSSLGRLRYAVLAGVGRKGFCLVDLKEAVPAAAPAAADALIPRDHAERVVAGARALAPYLGERMLPARLQGKPVVVRELLPQDLKLDLDRLTCGQAARAARFLAGVVGHAHARQMDEPTRQAWARELKRRRSRTLDAPSWLWTSVVDLIAFHEAAYLEHCRRWGLDKAA